MKNIVSSFVRWWYIALLFLAGLPLSCSVCPPAKDIMNGKALQHHDKKKFRATIKKQGAFYVVHYRNMQEARDSIYSCKPPFKSGSWVSL